MQSREGRAPWLRWLTVGAYFTATSLGHLEFSLWLVRERSSALFGSYAFKDAVPALVMAGGVTLASWVVHTARRHPQGVAVAGWYWGVWLVCVALIDRFLTYSVYEYAHYPQYALLAWLIARALDPRRTGHGGGRVLFWTTLLGIVDECMQYLWITPSYGNYLDFNDFLVNLLGAAAGVMLYVGARSPALPRSPALRVRVEWATVLGLALLLAVAFAAGRLQVSPPPGLVVPSGGWVAGADGVARLYLQRAPDWYGSVQTSPHRGAYRVLSPQAGVLALLLVGGMFGRYAAPHWRRARHGG